MDVPEARGESRLPARNRRNELDGQAPDGIRADDDRRMLLLDLGASSRVKVH